MLNRGRSEVRRASSSWRRNRASSRLRPAADALESRSLLAVAFTGNAITDFPATLPGVVVLGDSPAVIHPRLPADLGPLIRVSGFDISGLRLAYSASDDTLSVGIVQPDDQKTGRPVIAGDADNNGDGSTVDPTVKDLAPSFIDFAGLGGRETMGIFLDLNNDGLPDIVAGVPRAGEPNGQKPFVVAVAVNNPDPAIAMRTFPEFGAPLPNHTGLAFIPNTADAPSFEFQITRFSQLYQATTGSPLTAASPLGVGAFGSSIDDVGISEGFFPLQTVALTSIDSPASGGGGSDSSGGGDPPTAGLKEEFKPANNPGDTRTSKDVLDLGLIRETQRYSDAIDSIDDIDFYKFRANKGQIITFDIDSQGLDTYLKVFGASKKQTVGFNNDGQSEESEEQRKRGRNEPPVRDSFVRFVAPADGTYYLAVSNYLYDRPYDPDTTAGRDEGKKFKGEVSSREVGPYQLIVRTPNIHAEELVAEGVPKNPKMVRLTLTYEIQEVSIDSTPYFQITNGIAALYNGRIPNIDINKKSTNTIGHHTVVLVVDSSVFGGNAVRFLQLDTRSKELPYGRTVESDETDNSKLTEFSAYKFQLKDIPSIETKRGWVNGARLLSRWFSGSSVVAPKYASPPEYVDIQFILKPARSRATLTLLKKDYLAASAIPFTAVETRLRTQLIARAKRVLAGSNQETVQLTDFQSASLDVTGVLRATPDYHATQHLGFRGVLPLVNPLTFKGDDLYAALGNFSLYAAPVGTVTRRGEFAEVTISGIAVHVRDSFDFEKDQSFNLGLRYWKLPDKWSFSEKPGYTFVDNVNFREYRSQTGMGSDFEVYSDIRFEEFETPRTFKFKI